MYREHDSFLLRTRVTRVVRARASMGRGGDEVQFHLRLGCRPSRFLAGDGPFLDGFSHVLRLSAVRAGHLATKRHLLQAFENSLSS